MQNDNPSVVVGSFEHKQRAMSRILRHLWQSPVLGGISLVIVLVSLGGGAYAITLGLLNKPTPAAAKATGVTHQANTMSTSKASAVANSAAGPPNTSTQTPSSTPNSGNTQNKAAATPSSVTSHTSSPPSSSSSTSSSNSSSGGSSSTGTSPSTPMPQGVAGSWSLAFDDEFNGTSLNTSVWNTHNGWTNQNNVTDYASNVSVSGGNAILTLASSSSGAAIATTSYSLPVGGFAEARIDFPGNGTTIYNWPAWWISGPNWPAAGESDIAEGLGTLTVNYHSPSGSHNQGTIPGTWSNAFHTYGIYRGSNSCKVYYDGQLVKTYSTNDNGQPEGLILTVGAANTPAYGTASQVKVDYVRAWQ